MAELLIIPIAALGQYAFCPRRCGLMFVEQTFVDNAFTTEGTLGHSRVDSGSGETRGPIRTERALRIFSDRYGLSGIADFVEFDNGLPYPVEFKRGRGQGFSNNAIQLCAQAICLEEMFGCPVPMGAIFHLQSKRRESIEFDSAIREQTIDCVAAVRDLLLAARVPRGTLERKCDGCSLRHLCVPEITCADRDATLMRYNSALWKK